MLAFVLSSFWNSAPFWKGGHLERCVGAPRVGGVATFFLLMAAWRQPAAVAAAAASPAGGSSSQFRCWIFLRVLLRLWVL